MAALVAGCVTDDLGDDTGGGGKSDTSQTCGDAEYGDGVCHANLACGIPDIDCFETFATDADAMAWITGLTGKVALPESDPLYARARELTDRAWEAYKAVHHLGKLAEARVSVVVMQDPVINAWVTGSTDQTKVALSVHYHSAILAPELPDEEILGVVYHELAHITELHVLPDVYEQTRRFYVASGAEPIGAFQADDPRVRMHVDAWIDTASLAGAYTRPELGDMPLGGNLGALFSWMLQSLQPVCPAQVAELDAVRAEIAAGVSWLDDDVVVSPAQAARMDAALDQLAICNASNPLSVMQMLGNDYEWTSYLHDALTPGERELLDEGEGIVALQIITGTRRDEMRANTRAFERELGAPWTAARYFSTEEEADDISVRVTTAQKHADPGVSLLMTRVMNDKAPCTDALSKNQVPYGVRLDDPHHGTCWRIAHARQFASSVDVSARRVDAEGTKARRGAWVPTRPSDGKPMY